MILLHNDTDIPQVRKISGQLHFQLVGQPVRTVVDLSYAPHKYSGRKNIAEPTGLHHIAHCAAGMPGYIVYVCLQRIAALPLQIAEVFCIPQSAADAALPVQYRQYQGIVRTRFANDTYDTCTAQNAHFRLHAIAASPIDRQEVVCLPHRIGYYLGWDSLHVANLVCQYTLGIGGIPLQFGHLVAQGVQFLLQGYVLLRKPLVNIPQLQEGYAPALPFQHFPGYGIGLSEPYAALVVIETKKQNATERFQ